MKKLLFLCGLLLTTQVLLAYPQYNGTFYSNIKSTTHLIFQMCSKYGEGYPVVYAPATEDTFISKSHYQEDPLYVYPSWPQTCWGYRVISAENGMIKTNFGESCYLIYCVGDDPNNIWVKISMNKDNTKILCQSSRLMR